MIMTYFTSLTFTPSMTYSLSLSLSYSLSLYITSPFWLTVPLHDLHSSTWLTLFISFYDLLSLHDLPTLFDLLSLSLSMTYYLSPWLTFPFHYLLSLYNLYDDHWIQNTTFKNPMGDSGEPVTIFEGMKPKITFESRNVRVQKSF